MIGIKYRCFCDDSINIKVMGGKIPLQAQKYDCIYKERRKLPFGAGSCSHAIKEKKS